MVNCIISISAIMEVTTNVSRIFGKKVGTLTYFVDAIKGVLAILLVRLLCNLNVIDLSLAADADAFLYILALYTGIGVVLGHNYPFYMGFKGGKGIAASSECFTGRFSGSALFCFLEQHFRVNMFHLALSR